jgi:hypothetical protein
VKPSIGLVGLAALSLVTFVSSMEIVGIQGFSENRLCEGFGRRFTPWVEAAIGYQMQWLELGVAFINHTVMVSVGLPAPNR